MNTAPDVKKISLKAMILILLVIAAVLVAGLMLSPKTTADVNPTNVESTTSATPVTPTDSAPSTDHYGGLK